MQNSCVEIPTELVLAAGLDTSNLSAERARLLALELYREDRGGWRGPLFVGVGDYRNGLVGAIGSPQSACRTARRRKVDLRPSLAGRWSLQEIADDKEQPSAPARR